MIDEKVNGIYDLLTDFPNDLQLVESYIKAIQPTSEEITYAVIKHLDYNCFNNDCDENEKYGDNLYELIQLLLNYGLDADKVFSVSPYEEYNIIWYLSWVNFGKTAAQILRLILQNGANPNPIIEGEDIVSYLNFDIYHTIDVYDGIEYFYRMYFFLVLVAFGGTLQDNVCPIKMCSGYDIERLKDIENIDLKIIRLNNGMEIHITDANTDELIGIY